MVCLEMTLFRHSPAIFSLATALLLMGCASPYRADQGALFGGLTGAGLGAVVGSAVGDPLAGAAIGAGAGVLTGAVVGGELDKIEARNRAEIETRLGRQLAAGAVTFEDVIAMTRAGVSEEVIVNHVRIHGPARLPQANDLIYLQQNGVSQRVVQAMQQPPTQQGAPTVVAAPQPPPQVIVAEPYYGPAWHGGWVYAPPRPRRWHPPPGPSVGVGFTLAR